MRCKTSHSQEAAEAAQQWGCGQLAAVLQALWSRNPAMGCRQKANMLASSNVARQPQGFWQPCSRTAQPSSPRGRRQGQLAVAGAVHPATSVPHCPPVPLQSHQHLPLLPKPGRPACHLLLCKASHCTQAPAPCSLEEMVSAGWDLVQHLEGLQDVSVSPKGLEQGLASMEAVSEQRSRLQVRVGAA